MHPALFETAQKTWDSVRERWTAYQLLLPGSPSFICQAQACDAYCCRAYSVPLGDSEVARMERTSGLLRSRFLESEDGVPVLLPLAQPYLLARAENCCAMLGTDLGCTQYEGRPDACRLYPHFVLAFEPGDEPRRITTVHDVRAAVAAAASGEMPQGAIPLLVGHTECPGFTGPPLGRDAWRDILLSTAALQYPADVTPP